MNERTVTVGERAVGGRAVHRLWLVLLSGGVSVLCGLSSPVGVGPVQAQGPVPVEGLTSPSGSPPPGEMEVVYPNRAVGTLGGVVTVGVGGGASWTTSLKGVPGVAGLEPALTIGYGGGGYGGLGFHGLHFRGSRCDRILQGRGFQYAG